MWSPPNHALSPLLPALLALAELREADLLAAQGLSLLRALAIGIEAQARLRLSSRQFAPAQLSMHPPGVVGAIASALACASMLESSTEQATMAVGIAASRTGGILANVGSHTKALHCGDGAAHGLEAALLAQAGFSANEDALSGPRGWGAAYFGADFDPEPLLAPVGQGKALVPGPAWKLFPSQFGTHFGITAALDARTQLGKIDSAQVERVQLRAPPMPYIDRPRPRTGLEGKFSWQYTATVALLDGVVNLASFSDARRHSGDVEALLDRFVLVPDEDIPGRFDAMHVELQVWLKDGRSVLSTCHAPLGSWDRPIQSAAVEHKAFELLSYASGEPVAREVLEKIVRTPGEFGLRPLLALLQ
jgi:aconitate decarboxylase